MSKSVYSIVLQDEIVSAIDALAYQNNTSRSNMINRILAQAAGLTTPEEHTASLFGALTQYIASQNTLQVLASSDALLQLRSAIQYKYNPSVRYTVELTPTGKRNFALLRCTMRTQNHTLLAHLQQFYSVWHHCEESFHKTQISAHLENGKYVRKLRIPATTLTSAQLGDTLAKYIALLDTCMKEYFAYLPNETLAQSAVTTCYRTNMTNDIFYL